MKSRRQTLRVRPAPTEIDELLFIVNKLPRRSDESLEHSIVINSQVSEVDGAGPRYSVSMGIGLVERSLLRLSADLEKATEQLTAEPKIFVKPPEQLLDNEGEGWCEVLGEFLATCAADASGGLLCASDEMPRFGFGEVESMRQRYLFLFAVREIFEAVAEAHKSMEAASFWLEVGQSYSVPVPIILQVKALAGRFVIGERLKDKVGILSYAKPAVVTVLEKIEVKRIRICAGCEQLFWAGRMDQTGCSAQCANRLRSKRFREKSSSSANS